MHRRWLSRGVYHGSARQATHPHLGRRGGCAYYSFRFVVECLCDERHFADPEMQMLAGLERVNPLALSTTLCALCVIGSTIWLVPRWGLSGLGLTMAVSRIVTFWPIQLYEVRRFWRSSLV